MWGNLSTRRVGLSPNVTTMTEFDSLREVNHRKTGVENCILGQNVAVFQLKLGGFELKDNAELRLCLKCCLTVNRLAS